jgi:dihydrolipoamide dehydrogenase
MSDFSYDVVVIGSGPGGYVCAIRCSQLGLKTALVEKDDHPGGTCLNVGCIPSKALLHSTELFHAAQHGEDHGLEISSLKVNLPKLLQRKDKVVNQLRGGVKTLLKKRGVAIHKGFGSFAGEGLVLVNGEGDTLQLRAPNIVIATGSAPATLPFIEPDGTHVVTSNEAISFGKVPKSLVIVGAGAIGLELGSVWTRLGTKVTFLEFLPTIAAGSDPDVSKMAERIFKGQGMEFHTSTQVTGCTRAKSGVTLTARSGEQDLSFKAEKVLLCVGRKPFTNGLNLEQIGLATDDKGRIPVDNFRTSAPGVWAIGDVIDGPMLAHKAEEDGIIVAEAIAGRKPHRDYSLVPNVIYTHPEIASVGLTERAAQQMGRPIKTGKFPLAANGRAIAQDATEGFCKVIADANTDELLGAAIIAPGASEMIASVIGHMTYGGSAEDLGATIHAHPTVTESLKEAALALNGRAIHAL